MLADPVEGFLSGFGSGFGRLAVALLALFAGAAFPYLSLGSDLDGSVAYLWIPMMISLLFWWGLYDAWFFVGAAAFAAIFISLWSFLQERYPRTSFFLIFSSAALYFAPVCFREQRWVRALIIYAVCALFYGLVPYVYVRRARAA